MLFAALLALCLLPLPHAASVCDSKSPLSDLEKQYRISYSYDCRENLLLVKVLDSSGAPLNGVRVGLIDQNPPLVNNTYTNANADGLAGFSLEEGGDFFLFAYAYGACPGDGRFMPSLMLCDSNGVPIQQGAANETSAAGNESAFIVNETAWVSPRSLVRNFTVLDRPRPPSLPKPGAASEALSAEASLALKGAQNAISSALSSSYGRQDGNITSALSLLALAENAFANEDYALSRALAAQASSMLSPGLAPRLNQSRQPPIAAPKGGLSISDAETEGMLLNILAALGAIFVLWGLYYLFPKGPLD